MPEYRIAPDQGVCPEGHPCALSPSGPAFRECDTPHDWGAWNPASRAPYAGAALLDVYIGPVGVEAYHEAAAALRALMAAHESQEHDGRDCPGVEVCATTAAFALRSIQDVLDPLPTDPDALHCDHCAKAETAADLPPDWNGETGNHRSCEARVSS